MLLHCHAYACKVGSIQFSKSAAELALCTGHTFRVELIALSLKSAQIVLLVTGRDLQFLYLSLVILLQTITQGCPTHPGCVVLPGHANLQ